MSTPAPTTAMSPFGGMKATTFADRDSARSDQFPMYKGKTDQTDRIAIINPDFLLVAPSHAHFTEKGSAEKGLGYILCKSERKMQEGFEIVTREAACCRLIGEARKRCGTLIVKFDADQRTGKVIGPPVRFSLMGWVFSPKTYEKLYTIFDEYTERAEDGSITKNGLACVDLIVACEDEEYQKITITPSNPNGSVRANPKFNEQYGKTLNDWFAGMSARFAKQVARDVSEQEIIAKLGGGSAAGGNGEAPRTGRVAEQVPEEVDSLFN